MRNTSALRLQKTKTSEALTRMMFIRMRPEGASTEPFTFAELSRCPEISRACVRGVELVDFRVSAECDRALDALRRIGEEGRVAPGLTSGRSLDTIARVPALRRPESERAATKNMTGLRKYCDRPVQEGEAPTCKQSAWVKCPHAWHGNYRGWRGSLDVFERRHVETVSEAKEVMNRCAR